MTDLAKLRAVAEAATQGKWWRHSNVSEVVRCGQKVDGLAGEPVEGAANATHVATFDPPTVLQLLDDLAEARALFLSTLPRCDCGAFATKVTASEKGHGGGCVLCDECCTSDDWCHRIDKHAATIAKWSKP